MHNKAINNNNVHSILLVSRTSWLRWRHGARDPNGRNPRVDTSVTLTWHFVSNICLTNVDTRVPANCIGRMPAHASSYTLARHRCSSGQLHQWAIGLRQEPHQRHGKAARNTHRQTAYGDVWSLGHGVSVNGTKHHLNLFMKHAFTYEHTILHISGSPLKELMMS